MPAPARCPRASACIPISSARAGRHARARASITSGCWTSARSRSEPTPLPAAWDFARAPRLDALALDHCFGGWDGRAEIALAGDRAHARDRGRAAVRPSGDLRPAGPGLLLRRAGLARQRRLQSRRARRCRDRRAGAAAGRDAAAAACASTSVDGAGGRARPATTGAGGRRRADRARRRARAGAPRPAVRIVDQSIRAARSTPRRSASTRARSSCSSRPG